MISATPHALLLADIGQILGLLVVILFIVLPAIGNMIANARQKAAEAERARGQAAPGQPVPEQPAQRPRAEAVDDEIAEFLRRAAEARGEQEAPARPAALEGRPGQRPPRPRPRSAAPRPRRPESQPSPAADPAAAEVVRAEVAREPLSSFSRRADLGEFDAITSAAGSSGWGGSQEASRLGKGLSGQQQLGSLSQQATLAAAAQKKATEAAAHAAGVSATAAGVLAMLSSPENIQQAIILQEILHRPTERW